MYIQVKSLIILSIIIKPAKKGLFHFLILLSSLNRKYKVLKILKLICLLYNTKLKTELVLGDLTTLEIIII